MVLVDDQQPIGNLAAPGTDGPFAEGVRLERLRWAGENRDAVRWECGVEGAGELARAVPIRNLAKATRRPGSIGRLRAACVVRAPSGLAVRAAR